MEDHKNEIIVILAGYSQEMDDFLSTNPGLRSRFPLHLEFQDYTEHELLQIAEYMCQQKEYRLSEAAKLHLSLQLTKQRQQQQRYFGNARTVRNLIEGAIRRQALRLFQEKKWSREALLRLEPEDFQGVGA